MRRAVVIVAVAAIVLVGAATVLAAPAGPGGRSIVVAAFDGVGSILSDALDELVADETITQEQADAVQERVKEKAEERRDAWQAEREQRRADMEAQREAWKEALEDGRISREELDALVPEDHPLRQLDEFLDDGELSADELEALRGFRLFGPLGGRGGFHGHGLHDHGSPEAPPSPSPSGTDS